MTEQITNKKILLVDDDKFLLDMYAIKFSKAGYEVKAADSPDSALKLIKDGYIPTVMLVDIVMPGMTGFEILEAIKRENLAPTTKFIVLSNQGQESDIDQAKQLGADGYIIKASAIPSEVFAETIKIIEAKS